MTWMMNGEEMEPCPDPLPPEIKAEILRRRDEAVAHPEALELWDRTIERARLELKKIRRQKKEVR
jgi:hypothetical protein